MLLEFGKSNYLDKARQQPDKVRMVMDKVKTDGLLTTIDAVRSKLDQPLPLGYCNAGVVLEVGSGVKGFKRGDRVISNGKHAEVVCVPMNLCAKIPNDLDFESSAFTVVGAIGLQGIRLAAPTLGETFVVIGLGLIGLLTVQILHAHGCRVLAIDLDADRLARANQSGAKVVNPTKGKDSVAEALAFSNGQGVDGVLITAATQSSEPVHQAALMCRKRGRIVLVGVTGLELSRDDFFKKELTFQVSCSYGPGRYDAKYEEQGQDYPIGFVRWTEQRNFEAILDLMVRNQIDIQSLISHRVAFDQAEKAYEILIDEPSALGILLQYGTQESGTKLHTKTVDLVADGTFQIPPSGTPTCGFLGAGNYASRVLMPAFRDGGILHTVVTSSGVSGTHFGKKFGFRHTSTDSAIVFDNAEINTVVVATRHDTHGQFVCEALRAGKNIFVEKPLAITQKELDAIAAEHQAQHVDAGSKPLLMVGFNRRFAPQIVRMKELLTHAKASKSFIITVNAGEIPADHWTQDPLVGGGRIVGEGCHFIDLMRFLADSPITTQHTHKMGRAPGVEICDDKVTITLGFVDGSFGTIHYFANGGKKFPKERIEVFCGNAVLQLDNFRKMTGYGWPGFKKMSLWQQDKGQKACVAAFIKAVEQGGEAPIPFEELMEVSRVTIEIAEALQNE